MNIMKQLFLTFSMVIFILTSCQKASVPSPMETKVENGYKYIGYKNDSIPKKEGNIMNIPRKKDNTEFAEFRQEFGKKKRQGKSQMLYIRT